MYIIIVLICILLLLLQIREPFECKITKSDVAELNFTEYKISLLEKNQIKLLEFLKNWLTESQIEHFINNHDIEQIKRVLTLIYNMNKDEIKILFNMSYDTFNKIITYGTQLDDDMIKHLLVIIDLSLVNNLKPFEIKNLTKSKMNILIEETNKIILENTENNENKRYTKERKTKEMLLLNQQYISELEKGNTTKMNMDIERNKVQLKEKNDNENMQKIDDLSKKIDSKLTTIDILNTTINEKLGNMDNILTNIADIKTDNVKLSSKINTLDEKLENMDKTIINYLENRLHIVPPYSQNV